MSVNVSPAGSSGSSNWQLVVPTGITVLKRSRSCLDAELFNASLIQKQRQVHEQLSIFKMPWNTPSIIDSTLNRLVITPVNYVAMPDIQSSTAKPTASMTVRPQFTYMLLVFYLS